MSPLPRSRNLALLGVFLAASSAISFVGCSDDENTAAAPCPAELEAHIEAFTSSLESLNSLVASMKRDAYLSCANIAVALSAPNAPDPDAAEVSNADLSLACEAARDALANELDNGVGIAVALEGGACTLDADAQFECEVGCHVGGDCEPGTVGPRCSTEDTQALCDGSCASGSVCEGSSVAKAECTGSCAGNCEGSCDGPASGTCTEAIEEATCAASCKGTCVTEITEQACDGEFTGSCSGLCAGDCVVEATGAACTDDCSEADPDGNCTCTSRMINPGGACAGTCVGSCDAEGTGTCVEQAPEECRGLCTGDCATEILDAVCDHEFDGVCGGICTGDCTGACELSEDASCGRTVPCRGTCLGEATEVACKGALAEVLSCDDPRCAVACAAASAFRPHCSPSSARVRVDGPAHPRLASILNQNLGALALVLEHGRLLGDAAPSFAESAAQVAKELDATPSCALYPELTAAQLRGPVEASQVLSATVKAVLSASTALASE